ncbi:hypothetical protein SAMN02745124_04359 [Desulfofustis glycolicus DSM 9705]|uniref:Uncharacterized protein n=1 Tax=Desulfofustis glycolicus DSM 9705 TaxID=1121409 RepID=A0A1M5YR71_9BACT|nr:hypothetical protein SAMN02745124_04359 [Desulfofustis glycolicus DSM 9705]
MLSLQQQYNLVPGRYAKEMASVSVLPHLKSMVVDLATYSWKGVSALQRSGQRIFRKGPRLPKAI